MSDKKLSKIPKLNRPSRPNPLIDELHLEDLVYSPNQPRIFETKNLNSTCSFLQQLKTKLKNDVDRPSEDDSSDKNALRKISGIVSSILNTLNDVSDDLPSYNCDNLKEVTGEMVKVNKTSSLLSDSGKCYYMAQQLTVSHLHESDLDNKPIIDKQFLQQLTNLQALLQETIKKLEDKSTLTQEGKFNEKELNKSFKNRGLASLVQVDHESKPIQNIIKDYSTKSITGGSKKQFLNCSSSELTSQELSDYDDYPLEYKCCIPEDEEELKKYSKQCERILPPPKLFSNQDEKKISSSKNLIVNNLSLKNVTPKELTPKNLSPKNLSSKNITPKELTPKDLSQKSLSPKNITPKELTPKNITPKELTPKNITPKELTPKNITPKELTPKNITPKELTPKNLTPKNSTPKNLTPKNSKPQTFTSRAASPINIITNYVSPKNLSSPSPSKHVSLKSDSFKELNNNNNNDKFKEEIKNESVDEKKKDKKNENRMSTMWAFKSLKRSSERKVEQKDDDQKNKYLDKGRTLKMKGSNVQKKTIPEESKKKKENIKEKDSDNKSHKEKMKKETKKRKIDEKLSKKELNSIGSANLSKKSSSKTVRIQENSINDDNVLIPPPPLFDHDSYVDVEPYNEDSFLSMLKQPGELDKLASKSSKEIESEELQRSYTPEKKKSSVQFVTPITEAYSNLIDELTSTVDSFTSSAIQTTGSQVVMNSKSIQDNYMSFCSNQSAGSSNVFNSSVEQGINSSVVQMHYSVQASPIIQENQVFFESASTNTPGKSLEQISLKSQSVSVVMPKTQSQVVQAVYDTPIFLMPLIETTNEATSASTSLTEPKTQTEDRPSSANSSKILISKKTSFKSIDPNIAKLRCSNCMCTEGGPSMEKKSSKEDVVEGEIGKKLEEVEIFDKDTPQKYFNQVLNEIDMMKNCIEFAMDNQSNIHDKLKAYLDDGRIVKSRYPHFHTSIDGVPVILIWNDDPQSLANHLEIKQMDKKITEKKLSEKKSPEKKSPEKKLPEKKPPVKKLSTAKTKKFSPGNSYEKPPTSLGDNTFFFEKKRNMLKTRLLLDHLASAVAKCSKLRKKEKFRCDECGTRCPDKFKPAERSKCKITSSNTPIRVKSSCLNFRKKDINIDVPSAQDTTDQKKKSIFINTNSGVLGCRCDSEKSSYSDSGPAPRKSIIKTNSAPKCKAKKRCPFRHLVDDKSVNVKQPRLKRLDKHETTNIPSKTEAKSIQTYYLTPRLPQKKLKKSPQSSISDDSVNDIPYLIDAKSLPQFEHPETVCSSKLFDVKQVDCGLRNEIKTENPIVKDTLLRINLNALLDSFRPAKCCQKTVLNGKSHGMYPYPASLRSLPLSEEDLDRILQIIQSKKSKRFDTTKRLYEPDKFNSFQTANDPIFDQTRGETTRTLVYFFELFKKTECKTTPSSSSSSSSRTIMRPTQIRHDLKIFEFIKRIYNNGHTISDKRVLKKKKDSTKTLYRHRSKHARHHHHHHHYKRRIQKSTSTSMDKISHKSTNKTLNRSNTCSKTTSVVSLASHKKPSRNISFLLIPKSELNSYFCGELSSMYSPSLNSLPYDDGDLKGEESRIEVEKDLSIDKEEIDEVEINEVVYENDDVPDNIDDDIGDDRDDVEGGLLMRVDYGRTLGAIYETDESEKEDLRKENPCSVSEYSLQDLQESKVTTNLEVLTCKLSRSLHQSNDLLGGLKSSQDLDLPSTSSSLSTNFSEIPLQRKSFESDLSIRKHNIFSSSSFLANQSSSKIPISCIPLNCKDKPSFLNIPNIINDTKRFLHRQKEEIFKPNLDKIIEKTSETTSTLTCSSPRRRRKSLKRSHCSLSLKSSVSMVGKQTSTSDGLKLGTIPSDEEVNQTCEDVEVEKTQENGVKTKKMMRIDKAVVAYDISPSSQFTFLSGDTTQIKTEENKFKSENICVWPVFQNRCTKKRNRAFVVAIHSSAVKIGKKDPNQLGDQPNVHGDFCEICRKKTKLSSDSFLLGYIGEEIKNKKKSISQSSSKSDSKKERKDDESSKNLIKNTKKKGEINLKSAKSKHNSSKVEKSNKLEKKKSTTKKDITHPIKIKTKMLKRRPSIKILPEVIDIKVPTHIKSTRLRHTFCDKGDRPGYVTVLSTPCNCPDVTIFIPCYCSCCDGKSSGHRINSNYTMVPIIEKN